MGLHIHDQMTTTTSGPRSRAARKLTQAELWRPKPLALVQLLVFCLATPEDPNAESSEKDQARAPNLWGWPHVMPVETTCLDLPLSFANVGDDFTIKFLVQYPNVQFTSCHNMWVRSTASCKFSQLWAAWMHVLWYTGRRDLSDASVYLHEHQMLSLTLAS